MNFTPFITKIFGLLRIKRYPVVKVYNGYGNENGVLVYGHVLSISPVARKKYTNTIWINMLSLIRLFIVKPTANARVRLEWNDETFECKTEKDGFFKFEFKPVQTANVRWKEITVRYLSNENLIYATGIGYVFIPNSSRYFFVSDIDDTFLISHTANLRKRLYVLFTKNAQSRKPFEDVVKHYQLLARAGLSAGIGNSFFYVSSSEWNLYDYIHEFCRKNELPEGILLLSQMKRLKDFLKTGQGKHSEKYVRIVRILKTYPQPHYVLMGDDSQQDPEIYATLVRDFPGKIFAIYLRHVHFKNNAHTKALIQQMELAGVKCCYFTHSADAIIHSAQIGLTET